MDICHLKNAELVAKHQNYKGRVVLRGDIVKDDVMPNKKEPKNELSDPVCSEILEWLQELEENLVNDRVPEHTRQFFSCIIFIACEDCGFA